MHSGVLLSLLLTVFVHIPDHFAVSLSQAITSARDQGKYLILYFRSDHNADCQETDRLFRSEETRRLISTHYIAAWIDIADFDGKACQEIYAVTEIPAVVIVSEKGHVIYRANRRDINSALPVALRDPSSLHTKTGQAPPSPGESMTQSTVVRESSSVVGRTVRFHVQTGFFGKNENALQLKSKLEASGATGVIILEELREEHRFYRVLTGAFDNKEEATDSMNRLRKQGFEAKLYSVNAYNTH